MRLLVIAALAFLAMVPPALAAAPETATRPAYLDHDGVVRWKDDKTEVALFGANYCIMSGSDYRMAGGLLSRTPKP